MCSLMRRHLVAEQIVPGQLLSGRTALVTGGGTGIGRAITLKLAELGAQVFILGRTAETLEQTAGMAPAGRVLPIVADVREGDQVDAALDRILQETPGIDILVNNAGGQFPSPAEKISANGFRAVTRLNLEATWYLTTSVAARSMLPRGYGKVICITITPRGALPGMAHSGAARAAVESLIRTWAVEWGSRGVRTVGVAPGIVHTEAFDRYGVDAAKVAAVVPLRRLQRPDEIADLVAFIASPSGDYITGTTIVMDGGLDMVGPNHMPTST